MGTQEDSKNIPWNLPTRVRVFLLHSSIFLGFPVLGGSSFKSSQNWNTFRRDPTDARRSLRHSWGSKSLKLTFSLQLTA